MNRFSNCKLIGLMLIWISYTNVIAQNSLDVFKNQIILDIAVSPDSQFLAVPHAENIYILSIEQDTVVKRLNGGHQSPIVSLTYAAMGQKILSADSEGILAIWNVDQSLLELTLQAHEGAIYDIDVSPDQVFAATTSEDREIKYWSLQDGKLVKNFDTSGDEITVVRHHHKGAFLLGGTTKGNLVSWDNATGKIVSRHKAHTGWLYDIEVYSNYSTILTSGSDGHIKKWDFTNPTNPNLLLSTNSNIGPLYHAQIITRNTTYAIAGYRGIYKIASYTAQYKGKVNAIVHDLAIIRLADSSFKVYIATHGKGLFVDTSKEMKLIVP